MLKHLGNSLLFVGICLSVIQAATVSGIVSDSTSGSAVAGARVQLRSGFRTVATDTTDALGAFTFSVSGGTYRATATLTNYESKSISVIVDTTDVVVNIPLVKTVSGTVSGVVTDSVTGTPVAGAVVRLGAGRNVAIDTTGADGSYSFENVLAGNQTIQVSRTDYITKFVSVRFSGATTANVALVAIVRSSISGIVTDSIAGTPVAGATVRLGANRSTQLDTTGADGSYSFTAVTSGYWTIRVTDSGYISKTVTTTIVSTAPVTVNIPILAIVSTSVSGIVTNEAGAPLSGVSVRLGSQWRDPVDTTGADGAYSFANVSSGTYAIRASLSGYVTQSVDVSVVTTAPVVVNISMFTPGRVTVSGIITDSISGTPIAGATVRLGMGGRNTPSVTTKADGAYSFDSVSNSNQTIYVTLNGYFAKIAEVAFSGLAPVTQNIKLIPIRSAVPGAIRNQVAGPVNFVLSKEGIIKLTNVSGSGKLEIMGLDGKMLYKSIFQNGSSSIVLPKSIILNSAPIIVKLSTQGIQLQRSFMPFN